MASGLRSADARSAKSAVPTPMTSRPGRNFRVAGLGVPSVSMNMAAACLCGGKPDRCGPVGFALHRPNQPLTRDKAGRARQTCAIRQRRREIATQRTVRCISRVTASALQGCCRNARRSRARQMSVRQSFSGCHCTPTAKPGTGPAGVATTCTASIVPSGATPSTTQTGRQPVDALVVQRVHRDLAWRRPAGAASRPA